MRSDDPVAARLAGIRERAMGVSVEDVDRAVPAVREALATLDQSASEFAAKIAYDVLMSAHPDYRAAILRLLAAVETVLKLPAEWRQESEALRDAAGKVWEDDPDAAGVRLKHAYAAGYAECAKALEAVIRAALAGKEPQGE